MRPLYKKQLYFYVLEMNGGKSKILIYKKKEILSYK